MSHIDNAPLSSRPSLARACLRDASELLSSMRFAIALLSLLAVASVMGTVLKQNEPFPNYVNQFGPFWAEIFRSLSLYTVYSAWWYLLILLFLVISISLCIIRNAPKMLADMRSWKDAVHEGSLRALHHKIALRSPQNRAEVSERLQALAQSKSYRFKVKVESGHTLIAAKMGAANKLGYIFAHSAIVVICLGGLLDGDALLRLQMWWGQKQAIGADTNGLLIKDIPERNRLSASNPSFRANVFVPEGQQAAHALLNSADGTLIQDLPFSIKLNKFTIDYYSTGMPKLFASDIVVTDLATGKQSQATVKVNEPFIYQGVAIYQSSFEDGGSKLKLTGYPMSGASSTPFTLQGEVGGVSKLEKSAAQYAVEFTGLRPFNVENISDADGKTDGRGVAKKDFSQWLDARLGSGVSSKDKQLRNVGPSVQYKLRDASGQAREYNNYMLPIQVEGQAMFLAGMRESPAESFRYLRIPADDKGGVEGWMRLRAALQNPALRAEAAKLFAQKSASTMTPEAGQRATLEGQLAQSAQRALDLFAGVFRVKDVPAKENLGGFQSIARFIETGVPAAEQQKTAEVLLKILNGALWELLQVTRSQAGLALLPQTEASSNYLMHATNALSDSVYYGAPVHLQLNEFHEVKASVFQLTRSPGKNIVYVGCLLLVIGVFSMFYIRERRLWLWLKEGPEGGTEVLAAMSTSRKTLDFEKEFSDFSQAMRHVLPGASEVVTNSAPFA